MDKKPIKQADAVTMFMNGDKALVVEFRSSRAERITWRDQETKTSMTADILTHTVEGGGQSYVVSDRQPDGFKAEDYKAQFRKGDKVVLVFTMCSINKGVTTFSGTLVPLVA